MFESVCAEDCCGCGACAAICPKDAITMNADDKGFLYPVFLENKCVNCNQCISVCPSRTEAFKSQFIPKAYVCQNKNNDVLKNSTSGGVFTALSDYVLDNGGVVYGAVYDENLRVFHCRAENKNERDRMRGSKYVQSDISLVFNQLLKDLKDRSVLFTGTPCQVDAVKKYCARSRFADRLITCDIACYGVPSPEVFMGHVHYLGKRYHCKISDYWHRPASRGFQWGCENDLALTDTGRELYGTAWINAYRQLFYSGITKRDCCYSCKYTTIERVGDITIADCRQAKQLVPEWDLTDGVSSIIVSSEEGTNLLNKIREQIKIKAVDLQQIDQPPLNRPCQLSQKRDSFFDVFRKDGYRSAVLKVNKKDFALRYWVKKKLFNR